MAARRESDTGMVAILRAAALTNIGRFAEALAILGREPESYGVSCYLAHSYHGLGELDRALAAAERGVGQDPDDEWGHRLRAVVLAKQGRKKEALAAAERAVACAPHGIAALWTLVDMQLANGMVGEARLNARRMIELAPQNAASFASNGRVAFAENEWVQAEHCFRQALARDPDSHEYINNIGLALLRQGRRAAAIEFFHRAAKLEPRDETARRNLKSAMSRYVAPGGVMLVLSLVVALSRSEPEIALAVAVIVGSALLIGRRNRWRALPEEVRAFYRAENRRNESFSSRFFIVTGILAFLIGIGILCLGQRPPEAPRGQMFMLGLTFAYAIFAGVVVWRRRREA